MNLQVYRHLWGISEPHSQSFPKIGAAGYEGIETGIGPDVDKAAFRDLLQEYEFRFIGQIFSSGNSVKEHLKSFRCGIEVLRELSPVLINSHGGADAFSREESLEFFRGALEIEKSLGIPVAHETHRGRILFNPWITRSILNELPELQICADLSHFVCVCERLLGTELEIIEQIAQHTLHVHARVGYEEGPQVPDPRAPEYAPHLKAHETWWDLIWEAQRRRSFQTSTLTPEFGPPPYLATLPYTGSPVANLVEVCDWQAARQRSRFLPRMG